MRILQYTFKNAALLAAFFIYGKNPKVSYIFQKIDYVDGSVPNKPVIGELSKDTLITHDHILASAANSRAEVKSNEIIWRIGSSTVCRLMNDDDLWIRSGSVLFCADKNSSITIKSTKSDVKFVGSGTIIIEATSNGGFKFIPIEAQGYVFTSSNEKKKVSNGRLLLIIDQPSKYGNSYDIDLSLLLKSSRLINAFPSPLPRIRKLGLAVYAQELRLKGKYNALIGDATTNKNLQMWKLDNQSLNHSNKMVSPKKDKSFFKRIFSSD